MEKGIVSLSRVPVCPGRKAIFKRIFKATLFKNNSKKKFQENFKKRLDSRKAIG